MMRVGVAHVGKEGCERGKGTKGKYKRHNLGSEDMVRRDNEGVGPLRGFAMALKSV